MNVSFGSLDVDAVFYADGIAYRKLAPAADARLDNAITISGRRNSARFSETDRVETPEKVPRPSWWRRWLLARALRWQMSGLTSWARWSWRLARLGARGETEMRLAAYATQLLMVGE